jgi:hypothetical protein
VASGWATVSTSASVISAKHGTSRTSGPRPPPPDTARAGVARVRGLLGGRAASGAAAVLVKGHDYEHVFDVLAAAA